MTTRTLITGVTGQDGSYLAEQLLEAGHEVYGLIPHRNERRLGWVSHLANKLELVHGDMTDVNSLFRAVAISRPHYVYNLASQSFVQRSWEMPDYTTNVTYNGFVNLLEACRRLNKHAMIYQASTSEMFGNVAGPLNEQTAFQPCSPYAIAKTAAHQAATLYREAYDMYICCGILFNHESERRGEHFVTQKIAKRVAEIKLGKQRWLSLGNVDAVRDWGYAPEYVRAMRMMLDQEMPQDYVIGTGRAASVRDFAEAACDVAQISLDEHLVVDEANMRPLETHCLSADPQKATTQLGWLAETHWRELAEIMVTNWINLLSANSALSYE